MMLFLAPRYFELLADGNFRRSRGVQTNVIIIGKNAAIVLHTSSAFWSERLNNYTITTGI